MKAIIEVENSKTLNDTKGVLVYNEGVWKKVDLDTLVAPLLKKYIAELTSLSEQFSLFKKLYNEDFLKFKTETKSELTTYKTNYNDLKKQLNEQIIELTSLIQALYNK